MSATLADLLAPVNRLMRTEVIPYVLIGGYAVSAWGEVRATEDIDLLCPIGDAQRLAAALEGGGFAAEYRPGDPDDPVGAVVRVEIHSEDVPHQIDILAGIRGMPSGIFERARSVPLHGFALPVASPEDMIVLKMLAGSARDLEDARGIVRIQGSRLSVPLLRAICPQPQAGILETLLPPS